MAVKNYFTFMEERYNSQDFVHYLKPDQIQKYAKNRIFYEMFRGDIDYSKYGHYYIDPKFLENIIVAAQDELINNTTIYNALVVYDNAYPGDQNVIKLRIRYNSLAYVYNVLVQKLVNVKVTGNIGFITDIQYVLASYKPLFTS